MTEKELKERIEQLEDAVETANERGDYWTNEAGKYSERIRTLESVLEAVAGKVDRGTQRFLLQAIGRKVENVQKEWKETACENIQAALDSVKNNNPPDDQL